MAKTVLLIRVKIHKGAMDTIFKMANDPGNGGKMIECKKCNFLKDDGAGESVYFYCTNIKAIRKYRKFKRRIDSNKRLIEAELSCPYYKPYEIGKKWENKKVTRWKHYYESQEWWR